MGDVALFDPFLRAKQQAMAAGVPVRAAVEEVKAHQRRGSDGLTVVGKLRVLAWNRQKGMPMPDPTPPEAA